jgi:hypothetical protein
MVRQVDHVLIASHQARELFALLSDVFELPVAWPMSSYGNFASGGIAVGNVNLEIMQSSASNPSSPATGYVGLALEPEPLDTTMRELAARGIAHGPPQPFKSRKLFGPARTLWTTIALPTVSSETTEVFFCEYAHDVATRRLRLNQQLIARNGGPLSVQSVHEIVYEVKDLQPTEERWQKLLDPVSPSATRVWAVGNGPAIRLISSNQNRIRGLLVRVRSLDQARRFLQQQGLLETDQSDLLILGGSLLHGLNIALTEQRSVDG